MGDEPPDGQLGERAPRSGALFLCNNWGDFQGVKLDFCAYWCYILIVIYFEIGLFFEWKFSPLGAVRIWKCSAQNFLRIYASYHADGTFNSLFLFMEKLSGAPRLSDDQLLRLCEKYGLQAKLWRMKFCGLLPEVCKRRLYEKKRFRSIFEFALILGGLSEHQVRLVLNLDKRFEEMPHLHELLVEGKVSVNKLARVVSVVSTENEEFLSHQVRNLSQKALETLVRDMQIRNGVALNSELVDIQFQRHGMKSLFHEPGNFSRSIDEKNIALGSEMQTGDAVQISGVTDVTQNGFLKSLDADKSLRAQTFGIENNLHKEANSTSILCAI